MPNEQFLFRKMIPNMKQKPWIGICLNHIKKIIVNMVLNMIFHWQTEGIKKFKARLNCDMKNFWHKIDKGYGNNKTI